jgi:hypothetical protein
MMVSIGETEKDENGINRYGGQSLRRGGSQQLAMNGMPTHLIKLWGRWNSWVIDRYIREVPLQCVDISTTMLKGRFTSDEFKHVSLKVGEAVLVPVKKHDLWLQGIVRQIDGVSVLVEMKSKYVDAEPLNLKVNSSAVIRLT